MNLKKEKNNNLRRKQPSHNVPKKMNHFKFPFLTPLQKKKKLLNGCYLVKK